MYVVGVGLKEVYKALKRLARGALCLPLLMSMSKAFSAPFYTLIKLCYTEALEWSSLVPGGEEAKYSSLEITNPTSFTVRYHTISLFLFFPILNHTEMNIRLLFCEHLSNNYDELPEVELAGQIPFKIFKSFDLLQSYILNVYQFTNFPQQNVCLFAYNLPQTFSLAVIFINLIKRQGVSLLV